MGFPEEDHAVGADARPPFAVLAGEGRFLLLRHRIVVLVDDDEVVAVAVHLGEFQLCHNSLPGMIWFCSRSP